MTTRGKPAAAAAKPAAAPKATVVHAARKPAMSPKVAAHAKPAAAKHEVADKHVAAKHITDKHDAARHEVPKAIAKIVVHARPAAAPQHAAAAAKSVPAAIGKQAAQRISSAPITHKEQAAKAIELQRQQQLAAAAAATKKPVNTRHGFKTNEFIVYPAHGVGRIVGIEEQEIAGMALELFVITFEKDKMTLRVPTGKLQSVGMRKLADEAIVKRAMETLKGRARVKRTMWSRRAQEYEAKINSGDLISIAEVVRDLYRSETQPEQSYSERQLYEAALDRMAREIAAVDKLDERGAVQRITEVLSKSAKGRRAAEDAEVEAAESDGDEEVQAA
jgi:CarD family transcriptional regulator